MAFDLLVVLAEFRQQGAAPARANAAGAGPQRNDDARGRRARIAAAQRV